MAEIAQITVKMPRLRVAIVFIAARILSPFIRSEETGRRVGNAMLAWVKRGLRVHVSERRIY